MALNVRGRRINDSVLELMGEVTSFGEKEVTFDADVQSLPTNSVDDALSYEQLTNESMKTSAVGKQPDGVGVSSGSQLTVNSYVHGVGGSGAGDGVTPDTNMFSTILGGTMGALPTTRDGTTAAATPTTTEVSEGSAGNYGVGDLLPVIVDGEVEVAPIAGSALGVHTLGLALSAAPATGAIIQGSIQHTIAEAFAYLIQGRHVKVDQGPGNDQTSFYNAEFFGAVVTQLQLAAASRTAVQTCAATMRVANFARRIFADKVDPATFVPFANNYSRIILAKKGQTAGIRGDFFSVDVTINNAVVGDPKRGASGIGGWVRGSDSGAQITCTFHDSEIAPAGFTETHLEEIYLNRVNNLWHCLVQYGNQAGSTVAFYFDNIAIDAYPTVTSVDDIAAVQLVLAAIQGAGASLVKAVQC